MIFIFKVNVFNQNSKSRSLSWDGHPTPSRSWSSAWFLSGAWAWTFTRYNKTIRYSFVFNRFSRTMWRTLDEFDV